MLLSNAIALAQQGCCFEAEVQESSSSSSQAANVRREWNRTLCVFMYITDNHMALRLGLEPMLSEKSRRIVIDRFSRIFSAVLQDSDLWDSYFELTEEMRKVRELLQTSKNTSSGHYRHELVAELGYVKRTFDRWKRQNCFSIKGSPPGSRDRRACEANLCARQLCGAPCRYCH